MNIQINHHPVYHIIIDDFLPTKENEAIFNHFLALEDLFKPSAIGHDQVIDTSYRSNLNLNMDALYHLLGEADPEKLKAHRATSPLLKMLDNLMQDEQWLSMLDAAPFPLHDMRYCDYWSTQISRYGEKDHYHWHYDHIPHDTTRLITLIYYAHAQPKAFTGGELCLTDGLLWGKELMGEKTRVAIEPRNNRLVLFDSRSLHTVMPTQAPKDFAQGRFSVNVWIGRYQEGEDWQ